MSHPQAATGRRPAVFAGSCALRKVCWMRRHGAAAVEFAVVAPIFITLVFGMIEFGRVVMVQQLLINAAREGARVGVLNGRTATDAENRTVDYLTGAAISVTASDVDATILTNADDPGLGETISVSISLPYSRVSWLPTPMFLGDKTLTASSEMRRERVE